MRGIRDLLADHPKGISLEELLRLVQSEINPRASAAQLVGQLDALGDEVVTVGDRVMLRAAIETEPDPGPERLNAAVAPAGPRHLVAVDLETVLRYTRAHPDGERTIFQVGAMRFGPDAAWNGKAERFDRFVELSPELLTRITNEGLRARIEASGEPAEVVLDDLRRYLSDADAIVAYNGRAFDFPLLDEAMARALGDGLLRRLCQIDGLYLALAVWPVPPRRHALSRLINDDRFKEIREKLAIDLTGLVAHDAGDDVELLVDLMRFAAAEVEAWPEALAALVRSAGAASDAWQMLFEMVPGAPPGGRPFDAGEVRSTLAEVLVARGKAPLRAPAAGAPPLLDLSAVATGAIVDIDRVVTLVRGELARPRGSQRAMVEAMREWLRERKNALVEAPTGTGKSFAMLAVALEWLAADPRNRVVISTFTKALQRQLADDIAAMDSKGAVPGLTAISSLVKGSANRLSLAGLVRWERPGSRVPYASTSRGSPADPGETTSTPRRGASSAIAWRIRPARAMCSLLTTCLSRSSRYALTLGWNRVTRSGTGTGRSSTRSSKCRTSATSYAGSAQEPAFFTSRRQPLGRLGAWWLRRTSSSWAALASAWPPMARWPFAASTRAIRPSGPPTASATFVGCASSHARPAGVIDAFQVAPAPLTVARPRPCSDAALILRLTSVSPSTAAQPSRIHPSVATCFSLSASAFLPMRHPTATAQSSERTPGLLEHGQMGIARERAMNEAERAARPSCAPAGPVTRGRSDWPASSSRRGDRVISTVGGTSAAMTLTQFSAVRLPMDAFAA